MALTLTIGGIPVNFGLYLGLEEIDKPFLRRRLGSLDNDGDLYKCLWLNEGPATLEPVIRNPARHRLEGLDHQLPACL